MFSWFWSSPPTEPVQHSASDQNLDPESQNTHPSGSVPIYPTPTPTPTPPSSSEFVSQKSQSSTPTPTLSQPSQPNPQKGSHSVDQILAQGKLLSNQPVLNREEFKKKKETNSQDRSEIIQESLDYGVIRNVDFDNLTYDYTSFEKSERNSELDEFLKVQWSKMLLLLDDDAEISIPSLNALKKEMKREIAPEANDEEFEDKTWEEFIMALKSVAAHPDEVRVEKYIEEIFTGSEQEELYWSLLCFSDKFSEGFIEEHACGKKDKTRLKWSLVFQQQQLSEEFILNHLAEIERAVIEEQEREGEKKDGKQRMWQLICQHQKLSNEFIDKFFDDISWKDIFRNQEISEDFLRKWISKLGLNSDNSDNARDSWTLISTYQTLSLSFLNDFSQFLDWTAISRSQKLSESWIESNSDRLSWSLLVQYQTLSETFLEKYIFNASPPPPFLVHSKSGQKNIFNEPESSPKKPTETESNTLTAEDKVKIEFGEIVCEFQRLSEQFMERNKKYLNFESLSRYQHLTESFMERHISRIDWHYISQHQQLSSNFIRRFAHLLDWETLYKHQALDESLLLDHINGILPSPTRSPSFSSTQSSQSSFQSARSSKHEKSTTKKIRVDWYLLSQYQQLSESFIRKFRDRVDWFSICKYQKLSESFIEENPDLVDWENISEFQKLSESFLQRHQDSVDWWSVSQYQALSDSFKQKFRHRMPWVS